MITIDADYASYIDGGSVGMENIRTEDIFNIDTSSREIIVPESWTAVGVLQDHLAEKIWFSVDRFFDDKDFATAEKFMINFLNAANDGFAHSSTEVYLWNPIDNSLLDITEGYTPDPTDYNRYNKILFCWKISQNVTIRTGKVTFAVRLGKFTFGDEASSDSQWIWSSGLATLDVIESVSAENGLDNDNNEWSVNDLSRWFDALAKMSHGLNLYLDNIDANYHVFWSQNAASGSQEYIAYSPEDGLQTSSVTYPAWDNANGGPYRNLTNYYYEIDSRGFVTTAARDVRYGLWINGSPSTVNVSLPQINDNTPSTADTYSSQHIANTFLTTAAADNTYATKTYADNKITNTPSNTSTSVGLSASAVKSFMSSNYLSTSAINDSTTAANGLWSSSKTKTYIDGQAHLPTVTSTDAGKILMVDTNGNWVAGNPYPDAETTSF